MIIKIILAGNRCWAYGVYRVVKLLLCNYNNLFDCDYEYEEVDDRYIYFIVTRKNPTRTKKLQKIYKG